MPAASRARARPRAQKPARTRSKKAPPRRRPRLQLSIQNRSRRRDVPAPAALRRWALAALPVARDPWQLGIRIVSGHEGAAINRQFRGKTTATNVLSFPYATHPSVRRCFLGDVVICAPVVAAEAAAENKPLAAHWAHMVVHGILHLRGYDHLTEREARVMEALEARVLRRLGFANPYLIP